MCHVRELMTPQPVKVPFDQAVGDCARILWRLGLRHLPVVDANGRSIGVITDFDLLQHGEIIGEDGQWLDRGDGRTKAADLARTDPVECVESDRLREVIARMRDQGTDVALVLDAHRHPVGILTEHDVVRWSRLELPDEPVLPASDAQVVTVDLYAPALAALDVLVDHNVRHAIVTEDEQPVGVISWRDLVIEDMLGFNASKVREVLKDEGVLSLPVGATWQEIANTMVSHHIGFIPLIDEKGKVAMVLSRTDIMSYLIGRKDAT